MLQALDQRLDSEIQGVSFPVVTLLLLLALAIGVATVGMSFMVRFGR
jgi:hypothetical protein